MNDRNFNLPLFLLIACFTHLISGCVTTQSTSARRELLEPQGIDKQKEIRILAVNTDSPLAQKIEAGDLVTSIAGQQVSNFGDLLALETINPSDEVMVAAHSGEEVRLKVDNFL